MSDRKPVPYRNQLEISHHGKTIPYFGVGAKRPDGGANYGFKNLKGYPEFLDDIPELQEDFALRSLVVAINAPETAVFSIGCLSAPVEDEHGVRVTGFIEFALNSKSTIADAVSYFPSFFHFDRMLHNEAFADRVYFSWELAPANFSDANCTGFTAVITVNTDYHASKSEARECWERALAALRRFLPAVAVRGDDPIYSATTVGR